MKKVKNILFKIELEGNGIVNYDSGEQGFTVSKTDLGGNTRHNNVSYAKKNFYESEEDGKLNYKIKIASDCLRKEIFARDMVAQTPNISHSESIILSYIASPVSLLRGYLFPSEKTIKRKGAISMTDAEQTSNGKSFLEFFSKSGEKVSESDSGKSDTSIFKKETIGNITYSSVGNIDLSELQFVSADPMFDRYSFNPDLFPMYKTLLNAKIGNFNSELGYFKMGSSVNEVPEYGFKLSNENLVTLTKEFFHRLLSTNIRRNKSYASVTKVEYKLVIDPIVDTLKNGEGWITLTSNEDLEKLNFSTVDNYVEVDLEESKKLREEIDLLKKEAGAKAKAENIENAGKKKADNLAKKLKKEADALAKIEADALVNSAE